MMFRNFSAHGHWNDLTSLFALRFSVPHNYEVRWPFRDGVRRADCISEPDRVKPFKNVTLGKTVETLEM